MCGCTGEACQYNRAGVSVGDTAVVHLHKVINRLSLIGHATVIIGYVTHWSTVDCCCFW